MRRLPVSLFLMLLFCSSPVAAQDSVAFEGTMLMKLTSAQVSGTVGLSVSPLGVRIDISGKGTRTANVSVLSLTGISVAYRIDHTRKTYVELDLESARESQRMLSRHVRYSVKAQGNEKVSGYTCSHLTLTGTGRENLPQLELWVTKDIHAMTPFRKLGSISPIGGDDAVSAALQAAGADGFPVKSITTANGETVSLELQRLTKQKVNAALFEIPTDYLPASE